MNWFLIMTAISNHPFRNWNSLSLSGNIVPLSGRHSHLFSCFKHLTAAIDFFLFKKQWHLISISIFLFEGGWSADQKGPERASLERQTGSEAQLGDSSWLELLQG